MEDEGEVSIPVEKKKKRKKSDAHPTPEISEASLGTDDHDVKKKRTKKVKVQAEEAVVVVEERIATVDQIDPLAADPYFSATYSGGEVDVSSGRKRNHVKRPKSTNVDPFLFAGANLHEIPGYEPFKVPPHVYQTITYSSRTVSAELQKSETKS